MTEIVVVCPNCKGHSSGWPFGPCTLCGGTGEVVASHGGRWREQIKAIFDSLAAVFDADGGETCQECGRAVAYFTGSWWHADDELWAEVVEANGTGVLCPPCFTARCDALGIQIFWHARVEYRAGEDVVEGQRRAGLRS